MNEFNRLKLKKKYLLIKQELKNITYEVNEAMKLTDSQEEVFGTLWEIQNKINKIENLLDEMF